MIGEKRERLHSKQKEQQQQQQTLHSCWEIDWLDVLNTSIVIAQLCCKADQEYENKRITSAVGCAGI